MTVKSSVGWRCCPYVEATTETTITSGPDQALEGDNIGSKLNRLIGLSQMGGGAVSASHWKNYWRRFWPRFLSDWTKAVKAQLAIGFAVALLTFYFQVRASLIAAPAAKGGLWTIASPYAALAVCFALYHAFATVVSIHTEDAAEIERLRNRAAEENESPVRAEIEGAKVELVWSPTVGKFHFNMIAFVRLSNHDVANERRVGRIWVEIRSDKDNQLAGHFSSPLLHVGYKDIWLGEHDSFMLKPSAYREEIRITTLANHNWIETSGKASMYRTYLMIEVLGQSTIVSEIPTERKIAS